MHSRIFQLSTEPICEDDYIKEYHFYDDSSFIGSIADYVDEETDREKDIKWFVEALERTCKNLFIYDEKEQSIIFHTGFKQQFFHSRYKELKKVVENLTLEQFSTSFEAYKLKSIIEDKFDFYIYFDGPITKDEFIRNLQEEQKYYFGGTIDYHF